VHQEALTTTGATDVVKVFVGGEVVDDQADRLGWIHPGGDRDDLGLG
jgi:hypothetical protein